MFYLPPSLLVFLHFLVFFLPRFAAGLSFHCSPLHLFFVLEFSFLKCLLHFILILTLYKFLFLIIYFFPFLIFSCTFFCSIVNLNACVTPSLTNFTPAPTPSPTQYLQTSISERGCTSRAFASGRGRTSRVFTCGHGCGRAGHRGRERCDVSPRRALDARLVWRVAPISCSVVYAVSANSMIC